MNTFVFNNGYLTVGSQNFQKYNNWPYLAHISQHITVFHS